jgi:hypothetical protein
MFNCVGLCLIVLVYVYLCCSVLLCCSMFNCIVLYLIVLVYVYLCYSMFNCFVLCFNFAVLCIVFVYCVVLRIFCVQMCTVLLPPGVNPIAVNRYNKYLPPGPHVDQPWARISIIYLSMTQLNTKADKQTWIFSFLCNTYVQCNRLLLSAGFISIVRSDLYRAATRHSVVIYRARVSKANAFIGGTKNRNKGGKTACFYITFSNTVSDFSSYGIRRKPKNQLHQTSVIT